MRLENSFGIMMNISKIQTIMRKYNITCPMREANTYIKIKPNKYVFIYSD